MRLLSYNVLDGGVGRADPLAEVIEASRPDVVSLVEADDPDVVERIARRLDMDVIIAAGRRHSVALLSRVPIRESVNHAILIPNFTACLLEAVVEPADAPPLPIFVVHLHARAGNADEDIRSDQIAHLLRRSQPYCAVGTPHLLAGDFNANAPSQRIDLDRCSPGTRQLARDNGGQIPRHAIQSILDAGYTDTLAAVAPTAAQGLGSFTTQFPGQRVDYVFAHGFPAERLRSAWIEHDRLATYASDHYPVGVEIC